MRLRPGGPKSLRLPSSSPPLIRFVVLQETLKEKLERLADPYETNLYVKK